VFFSQEKSECTRIFQQDKQFLAAKDARPINGF